jgi:hypothetical protein
MVYVVARGIAFATQEVLKARATNTATGLYGYGALYGEDYAAVSGVWSKIKKGVKAVGRGVGKIVKAVGKVGSFVACGADSVAKSSITGAACSAGKAMSKAGSALDKAATDKKKKKAKPEAKPEVKPEANPAAPALTSTRNFARLDVKKQKEMLVNSLKTLNAKPKPKGLSTGAKVGIGLAAIAVVGGVAYTMSKKD